ncbi:MAG: CRISPR-associated endonuclease Cas6 [Thermodesulfobacteriota bacterium]|nr:CRISPR-associated endonuclease Cas6 [Thermodesulfobacteriota bacterium]
MKTIVARLITDKPVKKTAYQVKGVFMKQYPNSPVIPMLDGRYRNKFLYPRVQVKILNEQIYIIGIKDGADPVLEMTKELELLNFGNITFNIIDIDIEESVDQFEHVDQLLRYQFVSPWVALSKNTQNRYKFLKNNDRIAFLNRLLGQNIVFLAREMEVDLKEKVYTKLRLNSLFPKPAYGDNWASFSGEFQTNFVLPNYIGLGNGITRGYGAIHGLYNPEDFKFDEKILNSDIINNKPKDIIEEDDSIRSVKVKNVPKPRRKSKKLTKKGKDKVKKVLSEEYEIEDKSLKGKKQKPKKRPQKKKTPLKTSEDNKFNTTDFHKKQHTI